MPSAPIFPFAPDGASPITLTKSLSTDVMVSSNGTEVRHCMREVAVRTLGYTLILMGTEEIQQFLTMWELATQPLRFGVPIWPENYVPSAIAGAVVTVDRAPTLVAGDRVLLWQGDAITEEGVVDSIAGNNVTLVDPVVTDFVIGPTRLMQVMDAWLDPPTVGGMHLQVDSIPLVFHEELPGVSGSDPSVTGQVAPTPASITAVLARSETAYTPQNYVFRAVVRDGDGMPIVGYPVEWFWLNPSTSAYVPVDSITDSGIHASASPDGQYLSISYSHGGSPGWRVKAGSITYSWGQTLG